MIKKSTILSALTLTTVNLSSVQATQPEISPHEFSIGLIGNYYQYHEQYAGKPLMNLKGWMIGGAFSYLYTTQNQYVFGADIDFSGGLANYDGGFNGPDGHTKTKEKNVRQQKFEGRLKVGKNFHSGDFVLTPYTGFGVRIKSDHTKERLGTSRTGLKGMLNGWERRSMYFYIPLGLKVKKQINSHWGIETFGEVDILLRGKNRTEYTSTRCKFPATRHTQKRGYGLRAGFDGIKSLSQKQSISFGPYVNYWNIKKSNIVKGSIEPDNKTLEVGVALKYRF